MLLLQGDGVVMMIISLCWWRVIQQEKFKNICIHNMLLAFREISVVSESAQPGAVKQEKSGVFFGLDADVGIASFPRSRLLLQSSAQEREGERRRIDDRIHYDRSKAVRRLRCQGRMR